MADGPAAAARAPQRSTAVRHTTQAGRGRLAVARFIWLFLHVAFVRLCDTYSTPLSPGPHRDRTAQRRGTSGSVLPTSCSGRGRESPGYVPRRSARIVFVRMIPFFFCTVSNPTEHRAHSPRGGVRGGAQQALGLGRSRRLASILPPGETATCTRVPSLHLRALCAAQGKNPHSSPPCLIQRGGVEGVYCRAAVELCSYTALYSAV